MNLLNGYFDYSKETWKQLEPKFELFQDFLNDINPNTVLKTWGYESKADSPLAHLIDENNTQDMVLLKDKPELYWNGKNKIYTGFNIFGDGNIRDKKIFNNYIKVHLKDIPGLALGWTPNGNWLEYHKNKTQLELKSSAPVTGFQRLIFDIDKKSVALDLPERFKEYNSWSEVPSKLFFEWYVEQAEYTEVFINGKYIKGIVSQIVQQFSWVTLTPGGFHAYIELSDKQQESMKDMNQQEYKLMMQKFLAVVGDAMLMDHHIQNMNVVLRLPGSLHRKNRESIENYNGVYITTPYSVRIRYNKEESVDGAIVKIENQIQWGKPFELESSNIHYCDDKFFNSLMKSINETYESEEFRNQNFYNVGNKKNSYQKNYVNANNLKVSEMEIFKCMTQHDLTRAKIINNLPARRIKFSQRGINSLEVMDDKGKYQVTSGYKFYQSPLPSYTPKQKDLGGMFDFQIDEDTLIQSNYCGGYVNDFSNDRPEGPVLNFLYMYFKAMNDSQTNGMIITQIQKYLKEICPEIDTTKLGDWSEIEQVKQVVGTPSRYIIVSNRDTRIMAERQTPSGKVVKSQNGMIIFDKPVRAIKKVKVRKFGNIWTKDAVQYGGSYTIDENGAKVEGESNYNIKYCISWKLGNKKKYALIKKYATVKEYNNDMVNMDSYPVFMGDDLSLKLFYGCFDEAVDKTLESYATYGIEEEYGHIGSGYYIHPQTKEPFAILGNECIAGESPTYIDPVDISTKEIIDKSLQDSTLEDYISMLRRIGKPHIWVKSFLNAAGCASMNLKEPMKKFGWSISTNLSVYGPTQSGKSTLLQLIMSFSGYKFANNDSTIDTKKINGVRVVTLNGTTADPFKSACADYSTLFVDEVTSKDNSNKQHFLRTQNILREAINGSISQRGSPGGSSLMRIMNSNIISFGETPYSDESVKNRFVRVRMYPGTYYKDAEAFDYCASHTCYKLIHQFWFQYMSDIDQLYHDLTYASERLFERFKEYSTCTKRWSQLEAYGYLFALSNGLVKEEEYFDWIIENLKTDGEYTKETASASAGTLIRSINGILQYANSQNCSININVLHELGKDKNNIDIYMIELLPPMGSKRLNQIDTQVVEMVSAFNGLFVNRDQYENVKVVAYDQVRLDKQLDPKDPYHKKISETNWMLVNELKNILDSSHNRFYRKTELDSVPSYLQEEILSMYSNAIQ